MSTIEDNLVTLRVPSLFREWIESSTHGADKESRNTIDMQLAHEKSMIEHRNSNVSCPVENVARAHLSVSHEEDKIQYSNFEYGSSMHPRDEPDKDDRKPAAKTIKKEPEDEAQSWAQDEEKVETTFKPWEDKKDYEAIFRKYIYIGKDDDKHYVVIDMEIEAEEQ